MTHTLEELETVGVEDEEPAAGASPAQEGGEWARYKRERGWSGAPADAARRWRDEEGL